MNILLTGATGYIGSHIAKSLLQSGHRVYATCRNKSVFDKCIDFADKLIWLNQDKEGWQKIAQGEELDLLIHTAWSGVSAVERNNWNLQLTNFYFSKAIIDFSIQLNVKKIICFGSQAEYGKFDYKVNEDQVPYPFDAYGAVKVLTLHYLKSISEKQLVEWYWLRIFSIIGQNENATWLLPEVIYKLLVGKEVKLTKGCQCYDYLYMDDFIIRFNQIIVSKTDNSGIYNICSGRPVEIRQLLLLIAERLNVSSYLLQFGAVAYRENQNMFMVGSPKKFESNFGKLTMTSLEDIVIRITDFYKRETK